MKWESEIQPNNSSLTERRSPAYLKLCPAETAMASTPKEPPGFSNISESEGLSPISRQVRTTAGTCVAPIARAAGLWKCLECCCSRKREEQQPEKIQWELSSSERSLWLSLFPWRFMRMGVRMLSGPLYVSPCGEGACALSS